LHFQTEEQIMLLAQYPDYEIHKQKHQYLMEHVIELMDKADNNSSLLAIELSRFLTEWLIHHIKGEDVPLIKFLHLQPKNLQNVNNSSG
jgi:hemerythrin